MSADSRQAEWAEEVFVQPAELGGDQLAPAGRPLADSQSIQSQK